MQFSPRQLEVIRQVGLGKPNKRIALALGVKENTVKSYMQIIGKKLKTSNRIYIVCFALQLGLVQAEEMLDVWKIHRGLK